MSVIYHCKISVHTNYDGDTAAQDVSDAEVFATLEEAKDWGIKEVDKRVQALVDKKIPADYNEEHIDSWIDEWSINFVVYEFDPARKNETGAYRVDWHFDRYGNLIDRLRWLDETSAFCHMPGDDDAAAGTRFKIGDYVLCKDIHEKREAVYVVSGTPGEKRDIRWTNLYNLWGVRYGEFVSFVDTGTDFGAHESKLKLYEGEISENNPLPFLRMIALGEIKLTDEEWCDLQSGRIALNEEPSWREVLANIWRKE